MIEFTVRLNLPVRAVEVTGTTASPPEAVRREMAQWAAGRSLAHAVHNQSVTDSFATAPFESHDSAEFVDDDQLNQLRESLRSQQALFERAAHTLTETTKAVEKQLTSVVFELQEVAVELATAIASKLVFDEVNHNRFPIANLIHEVLGRLDTRATAIIRLHPDDLAVIQELPVIGEPNNEQSVQYVADPALARGDCKAKAGDITVSYELRRQIEDIRQQLLSTVSGHAETGS